MGGAMSAPDPVEYLEKVQELRKRVDLIEPGPRAEALRENLTAAEERTREFLDGEIEAGEWLEAIAMLAVFLNAVPPAASA
jgi:hypothetical protein